MVWQSFPKVLLLCVGTVPLQTRLSVKTVAVHVTSLTVAVAEEVIIGSAPDIAFVWKLLRRASSEHI